MPRRREVPKRDILPDPKFGNVEVSKFINAIMQSGKKSVAERIVYGAFSIISPRGKGIRSRFSVRSPWQRRPWSKSSPVACRWCQLSGPRGVRPVVALLWRCAGCANRPASVPKNPWVSAWLPLK